MTSVRRVSESPEGLDLDALGRWLADHVDGARAELSAGLIAGGRSNLTYAVTDGTHEWVVRRPPLGHVVETAHDMGREYRVITALQGSGVPVPVTRAFCADVDVIGAPFYVMDRVNGRVIRSVDELATFGLDDARHVSQELVDVLARLHGTDLRSRRPRGLRQARRLPGPQRRAVGQAVGSQQDARSPTDRRARPPRPGCAPGVGAARDRAR